MSNYKRLLGKTETRYVIEFASGSTTGVAAVGSGSVVKGLGGIQRRGNLLTPVEEKETISVPVTQKPRQGPLRPQTGAGQHRDKKKEQKAGKEKHKKSYMESLQQQVDELKKPSGSMFLKFRVKKLPNDEEMTMAYGGFGTTPKDVTVANARIKPFGADDSADVISRIRSILGDRDFVGVKKIILDIPGSLTGRLADIIDYAERDERLELYTDKFGDEPEASGSGKVIGYGPDGKRINREPPQAQVGGSSRGVPNTAMVTVTANPMGQKLIHGLLDQGKISKDTKIQGSTVIFRKATYDQIRNVLGNDQFQRLFTKTGSVAEDTTMGNTVYIEGCGWDDVVAWLNKNVGPTTRENPNWMNGWFGRGWQLYPAKYSDENGRIALAVGAVTKLSPEQLKSEIEKSCKKVVAEGMDSLTFWKQQAKKAGGAANIDWYAIGVEHGKQGIVMNPPYGVGAKAVTLYGKGLDAGKQGVAEGLVGDVVVHNYTKMPIDLKPGQAQIHGWGPNDEPLYRVKGHDGKEVITSNKKKMMMIARGQGVAEGDDYDQGEYNDEAGMVKNNIHTIVRVMIHLEKEIADDENIPEWCQEKIAAAKGMLVSVMDYMLSQQEMGIDPKVDQDMEETHDNDPLQARADYAQRHGQGQVYKKTYPGDKTRSTKSYAYDIKRTGPRGQLPKEDVEEEKIKGVDGKACWKGKRYAGKVKKADGTYKDKCVPVGEDAYTSHLLNQLETVISEKAVSKAQQKFMGMVHAVQKGEMKAPSKEVAKTAKGMSMKAGHDFAATKHKGLPEKKPKK